MIVAGKKAKAVYSFAGGDDDELTLAVGDIVNVLGRAEDKGWWKGQLGNKTGEFPSNYVVLMEEKDTQQKHPGLFK